MIEIYWWNSLGVGALARRLNPTGFVLAKIILEEEKDMKSDINNDPKDTGQEELEDQAQKIMDDIKKLICQMVFPRPCENLQLEISSSERKTSDKPRQKRAENVKSSINFMLRPMKR